jgi:hypothetical protein
MVQDLQDLFKMLNLAYGIRIPDCPLGSLCIRKAHINILSILLILSITANPSPRDLGWPGSLTRVWEFLGRSSKMRSQIGPKTEQDRPSCEARPIFHGNRLMDHVILM